MRGFAGGHETVEFRSTQIFTNSIYVIVFNRISSFGQERDRRVGFELEFSKARSSSLV
jgi:hypothetical protein